MKIIIVSIFMFFSIGSYAEINLFEKTKESLNKNMEKGLDLLSRDIVKVSCEKYSYMSDCFNNFRNEQNITKCLKSDYFIFTQTNYKKLVKMFNNRMDQPDGEIQLAYTMKNIMEDKPGNFCANSYVDEAALLVTANMASSFISMIGLFAAGSEENGRTTYRENEFYSGQYLSGLSFLAHPGQLIEDLLEELDKDLEEGDSEMHDFFDDIEYDTDVKIYMDDLEFFVDQCRESTPSYLDTKGYTKSENELNVCKNHTGTEKSACFRTWVLSHLKKIKTNLSCSVF